MTVLHFSSLLFLSLHQNLNLNDQLSAYGFYFFYMVKDTNSYLGTESQEAPQGPVLPSAHTGVCGALKLTAEKPAFYVICNPASLH